VLQRFGSTALDNPGRLERWPWRGATVLLDYAHNPDGLAQLLSVARALKPQRLGLLLGQAGNRDDAAIAELARVAAGFQPGRVVVKELPGMLRGRAVGELPALIESTLLAAGLSAHQVQHHADELEAAQALLAWAEAGDVLVLPIHTAAVRTALAQVLSRG
jgi:UDP-N-acetylmuramyl tripeptide synthase